MKAIEILLVEDSDADAELTCKALKNGKIPNSIHRVIDGVEAMSFLRRLGEYESVPRPDLILLDLNMPRMDGKEVLRELRKDLSLRLIPVVVLSTSDHDKDVLESYGLDSNAYIVKPVEVSQFFEVVRIMQEFWVSVVKLPLSDVQPKA